VRTMNIYNKDTKKLLTPASGFLEGYTFSLNPYIGCGFGCHYCYVRKMPVNLFRKENWGTWVDIKRNAQERYLKEMKTARRKHEQISIFMSSSTDPYQPIEHKTGLTRSLLEAMVQVPPDFLFIQTRSPLINRDVDLIKKLKERVLVSMTIETDREEIRKIFSPAAPPIQARFQALKKIINEGIPAQAAIAPLLPSSDSFASKLSTIVTRVTIDDYFMGDGSEGKRTKSMGIDKLYKENHLLDWYHPEAYKRVVEQFLKHFSEEQIFISKAGFKPITPK
jgi:DNA repair photolyase